MKWEGGGCSRGKKTKMVVFRERVFDFSLEMQTIRPSVVFETRRKNVLHGAGYVWTPDL